MAVKAFLEAINPYSVNCKVQMKLCDTTHIVFQLNFPSYDMLRRYGNFVKSTWFVKSSNPTKNSSKLGASRDNVAKRRPLGVKWLLITLLYSIISCDRLESWRPYLIIFSVNNDLLGYNVFRTLQTPVFDNDFYLSNLIYYQLATFLESSNGAKKMPRLWRIIVSFQLT